MVDNVSDPEVWFIEVAENPGCPLFLLSGDLLGTGGGW